MAAVPPICTPPHSPNSKSSSGAASARTTPSAASARTTPSAASTRATPKNSQLKAAGVVKRVFKSPPRVLRNFGVAPTPAGKRRGMAPLGNRIVRKPSSPAFPGANLVVETPLSSFHIPNTPFSTGSVYMDGENPRSIIKQPLGSKSCWAYSFAMLLTDVIRSGKELNLDESFGTWFARAYLLTAEKVQGEAERLGPPLTFTNIPQQDPLDTIKRQLETSGFPVLVTIEHPIYSGHTIVIDKITDTHTTVHDPADGRAIA